MILFILILNNSSISLSSLLSLLPSLSPFSLHPPLSFLPPSPSPFPHPSLFRCYLEDGASKGAWLNRSSIIFAGGDKWSVDPRVSISTLNKRDYSLQIQNVDVTDDGPYTCSVQTQHTPRTMQVHLTVQGECFLTCCCGGLSLKCLLLRYQKRVSYMFPGGLPCET